MEQELRKQAIKRYLKGEPPQNIYTDLNRSKNWFFKWLKRFQTGDPKWYQDKSKAPKTKPSAISETEQKKIVATRRYLESQKFAQIGTSAIKWELEKSGEKYPSDRTIHRILKKEGLVKKKQHTSPKVLSIPISMRRLISTISTRPTLLAPDI